jgi:hypothetical protein
MTAVSGIASGPPRATWDAVSDTASGPPWATWDAVSDTASGAQRATFIFSHLAHNERTYKNDIESGYQAMTRSHCGG